MEKNRTPRKLIFGKIPLIGDLLFDSLNFARQCSFTSFMGYFIRNKTRLTGLRPNKEIQALTWGSGHPEVLFPVHHF